MTIFVDSNLFIYAVGRDHPLKAVARNFFLDSGRQGIRLVTSSEVLQELLHVYLPVARLNTLDAALELVTSGVDQVFPISKKTVLAARDLATGYPELTARDLIHLAVCQEEKIEALKSFDRALSAAFEKQKKR